VRRLARAPAAALVAVALLVAACRTDPAPAPAAGVGGPDFSAVFASVAPAVVRVMAGRTDGDRFLAARFGSGFVWDLEDHIVTNDHVVGTTRELRVSFEPEVWWPAALVGRDASTDLALLRVDRSGASGPSPPGQALVWPAPPPHGDAASLRPGAWVAAIGNPHEMVRTISVGVVSATGRRGARLEGTPQYADFIQTDADLNPGSSGGPLVDGLGRVVGLSTAVMARAQGIAFATPIDQVETVVESLRTRGRFVRGFAGFTVRPVRIGAAAEASLQRVYGALVQSVVPEGPAERAGLKGGDIVLKFGATKVEDSTLLPWLVAASPPGAVVEVRYARGTQRGVALLTLSEAP